MSLTKGQARFAQVFAGETGLSPKVVGAWLLAEQSGSAAQFYERKGYNNWLNIARTDSGDAGGAHSGVWSNPDSAAKASAEWMRGQGKIAHEYGKPASGIMAILGSHGQPDHRQIQAISRSGWASSGYNGGSTLSALLGQTGHLTPVKAEPKGPQARPAANGEHVTESTVIDKNALKAAQDKAAGIRGVAGLFPGNKPGDVLLREALEQAGAEPTAQQFTSKSIIKTPTGTYHSPATPNGEYVHPIPGGKLGRTDMGLDISAAPGTPIRAIGDSKVVHITPDWYAGQPYVEFQFLNGPRKGQNWFAAEQIAHNLHVGQYVRGGHPIGHVASHGTALEFGFGGGGGRTKAQATTGYNEGEVTQAGKQFTQFAKGLRK